MSLYIKNADTQSHTWTGQIITAGSYYEIEALEQVRWSEDNQVLVDLANGILIVATSNDGNNDITDVNQAINYLKNNIPPSVKITNTVITDKGESSFDTIITHDWTDNTTWTATDDSLWQIEPSASTKQVEVTKAELQFTHDVKVASLTTPTELYFDIWVYNPLYDSGQSTGADDPTFVPGVSSGNPLRFLHKRTVFASLRDVFNYGNEHFTMPNAVDGETSGVTTVQFNYDQKIVLRGSQGAQLRLSTKNDIAMDGGFCTVSFVIREVDE